MGFAGRAVFLLIGILAAQVAAYEKKGGVRRQKSVKVEDGKVKDDAVKVLSDGENAMASVPETMTPVDLGSDDKRCFGRPVGGKVGRLGTKISQEECDKRCLAFEGCKYSMCRVIDWGASPSRGGHKGECLHCSAYLKCDGYSKPGTKWKVSEKLTLLPDPNDINWEVGLFTWKRLTGLGRVGVVAGDALAALRQRINESPDFDDEGIFNWAAEITYCFGKHEQAPGFAPMYAVECYDEGEAALRPTSNCKHGEAAPNKIIGYFPGGRCKPLHDLTLHADMADPHKHPKVPVDTYPASAFEPHVPPSY